MEIVTDNPLTKCTNCKKEISTYYYYDDLFSDRICVKCLIEYCKGYPSGVSPFVPCKLCRWPYIRWYQVELNGVIRANCGWHESAIDSDGFDMF